MTLSIFAPYSLEELQQLYAHAESIRHLIDDLPAMAPLAAQIDALLYALEFYFQEADPLVDRQPVVVRSESLEVQ